MVDVVGIGSEQTYQMWWTNHRAEASLRRCMMYRALRQCIKALVRSRRSGVGKMGSSDNSVGMTIDTNERLWNVQSHREPIRHFSALL